MSDKNTLNRKVACKFHLEYIFSQYIYYQHMCVKHSPGVYKRKDKVTFWNHELVKFLQEATQFNVVPVVSSRSLSLSSPWSASQFSACLVLASP
jgi:hypothetical protein